MAKIPKLQSKTNDLIGGDGNDCVEPFRDYLGMSGIGDQCKRNIWLNFRWATKNIFPERVIRIFNRGDIEEARVIKTLKNKGISCFRVDDEGNEIEIFGHLDEPQEEFVDQTGHAKGHPDGRARGFPEAPKTVHLLEIKTMNNKYFNLFKNKGIEKSHPKYFSQVQRYMPEAGLDRAMIIATNKDNEERWSERVKLDKTYSGELKRIELELIISEKPPALEFSPTWFSCKFCDNHPICHDKEPPLKTCRSCEHVELFNGGIFKCTKHEKELDKQDQLEACGQYKRGF